MSKLDSVIMNSKEMQLVTGGDANIPMKAAYKNKESCKSEGAHLLDIHVVKDMTIQEIAEEILAHAVAYYKGDALRSVPGVGNDVADYLIAHGAEVYIADGGDTWYRKAAYSVIWTFFESF